MRPVRASEIGSFLYCARAWWYQRQGVEAENQAELTGGELFHRRHGQKVVAAGLMRLAGLFFLLVAVLLLATGLTVALLP